MAGFGTPLCAHLLRGGARRIPVASRQPPRADRPKKLPVFRVIVGAEVECTFCMVYVLGIVFVFVTTKKEATNELKFVCFLVYSAVILGFSGGLGAS